VTFFPCTNTPSELEGKQALGGGGVGVAVGVAVAVADALAVGVAVGTVVGIVVGVAVGVGCFGGGGGGLLPEPPQPLQLLPIMPSISMPSAVTRHLCQKIRPCNLSDISISSPNPLGSPTSTSLTNR